MKFLVLGAGAQGSAAAYDLLRQDGVETVVLADQSVESVRAFLEPRRGDGLETLTLDATDPDAVREAMEGVDAVACALPYFFNLEMTRLAVEVGAHFCDLGGNTEIVEAQRELDDEATERGVSVVPDCGLAPGMVNILAQAAMDELDETASVRILVGGLPQDPEPPLNYQIVYSMEGVLDYYTTEALVLEGGELARKEALTGVEEVEFPEPVGRLEAFYTAGGISTLPLRYRGEVGRMEYKTLRYPGHAAVMRAIRDLGLLDTAPVEVEGCEVVPRRLFIDLVSPRLRKPGGRDLVAMRVEVEGTRQGVEKTIRFELLDRYDEETGITAMMRTTGYSLALTALMQADGRIRENGVRTPDEAVPPETYLSGLAVRGIHVERTDY